MVPVPRFGENEAAFPELGTHGVRALPACHPKLCTGLKLGPIAQGQ